MKTVLYIHGKGGNASESTHYEKLFPDCKVIGLDYKTLSPWETGKEIHEAVVGLKTDAESIILIANSIGAFFSMNANLKCLLSKAPSWWGSDSKDIYDNLIFAIAPHSIETVAEKIGEPSAELEKVKISGNTAFWSFDRKLYAKANWWKKTAAPGIGEMITIRTANTLRKIAEM